MRDIETDLTKDQRNSILKVCFAVKAYFIIVFLLGANKTTSDTQLQRGLFDVNYNQEDVPLFSKLSFFQTWDGSSFFKIMLKGISSEQEAALSPGMPLGFSWLMWMAGISKAVENPAVLGGILVLCSVLFNLLIHLKSATLMYKLAKVAGCFSDHALRIAMLVVFCFSSIYHVGFYNDSWYLLCTLMAACKLVELQTAKGGLYRGSIFEILTVVFWLALASSVSSSGFFNFFYLLPSNHDQIEHENDGKKDKKVKNPTPGDKKEAPSKTRSVVLTILGIAAVTAPVIVKAVWTFRSFCGISLEENYWGSCSNVMFMMIKHILVSLPMLSSPWYFWWLALVNLPIIVFNIKRSITDQKTNKKQTPGKLNEEPQCTQLIPGQKWVTLGHSIQSILCFTQANRYWHSQFYYYLMMDEFQAHFWHSDSIWQAYVWSVNILNLLLGPAFFTAQLVKY